MQFIQTFERSDGEAVQHRGNHGALYSGEPGFALSPVTYLEQVIKLLASTFLSEKWET